MKTYKVNFEITAEDAKELQEMCEAINRLLNNLSPEDLQGMSFFVEQNPQAVEMIKTGLQNPKQFIAAKLKGLKFW